MIRRMDTAVTHSYPRTYRMSPPWQAFVGLCGVALAAAGVFGAAYVTLQQPADLPAPGLMSALFGVTALIGAYALLGALRYAIILSAEAIEIVEPFFRRRMRREDIGGWRLQSGRGYSILLLVPKAGRGTKLRVSLLIRTDAAFEQWFTALPDLDHEEVRTSERELKDARYAHLSREEQARSIERLRTHAQGFVWGSSGVCVAALFLPDPYHLLALALIAMPWVTIALVARFQPLYRIAARRNDQHPDLTLPLMTPGLVLLVRVIAAYHPVLARTPLMLALYGGAALTLLAARADPWFRQQRVSLACVALFACAYGYGAGMQVNALADLSSPRLYSTSVLDKHVSRGRRSTTWYLSLAPWGPVHEVRDVSVPVREWQLAQRGDELCIALRSGALAIHWYELAACGAAIEAP